MSETVLVAVLSFSGTLIGTVAGIITSGKLTSYRIEQLEKKVDRHNNFALRLPVVEEQIKVINHRIKDMEMK